jgi:group II intron reverse transcriptase/maturase
MLGTKGPESVSTKLQRIAELAKRSPAYVLTTLAHHIDADFLREAYRRTRKDGAVGVDAQTAAEYEASLNDNLDSLLERFKSGTYRAPPVRRVHIPKEGGRTRPIGIPTFEDKVLQRAVVMVLEAVYEQDFLDCSYGFRPGRSAHQALQVVWDCLMSMGGAWVLEVDIQSFFDSVDHRCLRNFLDQRVRDGVLRRTVDKWLKAGVLEAGTVWHPDLGTPQGGVISPLLANVYLHEVIDVWFHREVKPRLGGRAELVRYADDVVILFAREDDARRVMDVLPKRLGRHGLTLHPEKTRLIDFRRRPPGREPRERAPRSFDLLGFTICWGRSRKGRLVVKKLTSSRSLTRALKSIWLWCKRHRHLPVREQHRILSLKVKGHYGYFGVTGNARGLRSFLLGARRAWRRWLGRRSQRGFLRWELFERIWQRYPLPMVRIVHSALSSTA